MSARSARLAKASAPHARLSSRCGGSRRDARPSDRWSGRGPAPRVGSSSLAGSAAGRTDAVRNSLRYCLAGQAPPPKRRPPAAPPVLLVRGPLEAPRAQSAHQRPPVVAAAPAARSVLLPACQTAGLPAWVAFLAPRTRATSDGRSAGVDRPTHDRERATHCSSPRGEGRASRHREPGAEADARTSRDPARAIAPSSDKTARTRDHTVTCRMSRVACRMSRHANRVH